MEEHISVREWQKKYKAGEFDADDDNTRMNAGWEEWIDTGGTLLERLKDMAQIIMEVKSPYILDNYYLSFLNTFFDYGPMDGLPDDIVEKLIQQPMYDIARFIPLGEISDEKYFIVHRDDPYERYHWSLCTKRSLLDYPECLSNSFQEIADYINEMGQEFSEETTGQTGTERNTCDCGMRGF